MPIDSRARRSRVATFDETVAAAPEELRKGPRGGGRDTSKMIGHVVEADEAYAREIGIKLKAPIDDLRAAMLDVLRQPSDGSPIAGRRWTPRSPLIGSPGIRSTTPGRSRPDRTGGLSPGAPSPAGRPVSPRDRAPDPAPSSARVAAMSRR